MVEPDGPSTHENQLAAVRDPANAPAWDAFVTRYQPFIRDLCRRFRPPPGDEDELIQAVLVRLFEKLPEGKYDPRRRFRGWLREVVKHEVANHWRRKRRRPGDYGNGRSSAHELLQAVAD